MIRRTELSAKTTRLSVAASTTIERGAAVSVQADGYVAELTAGEKFAGFALETVDNSSGADGDLKVTVQYCGAYELTVASVAITDLGVAIYASAKDTFTTVSTSNSAIGKLVGLINGVAMVKIGGLE